MNAFRASYADWKVIKTRACVQVVFEVPIELADAAYQVLGGMPQSAKEVWCGVARLDPEAVNRKDGEVNKASSVPERESARPDITQPRPSGTVASVQALPPVGANKERRAFSDMPPTQQAGMLCADRAFRLFLAEKFDMPLPDPEEAANVIRHHCKVKSRKEITADNADWSGLVLAYRLWQREPEFV